MGQKTHPFGFRLSMNKNWRSRWIAGREYANRLHEDFRIRAYIKERLGNAGISHTEIERTGNRARVNIYTARPGIVIGRRGQEVDRLKAELEQVAGREVFINIIEVKRPEQDAQLVSESIALQLERRVSFRRALKKAVQSSIRAGAQGVKVQVSGRLGGAEIARREWYREGRVPLHTLRANIDYGFSEAKTTFGKIGVKVWVFLGEQLPEVRTVEQPAS